MDSRNALGFDDGNDETDIPHGHEVVLPADGNISISEELVYRNDKKHTMRVVEMPAKSSNMDPFVNNIAKYLAPYYMEWLKRKGDHHEG